MKKAARKVRFADHFTPQDALVLRGFERQRDDKGRNLLITMVAGILHGFMGALQKEGRLPEIAGVEGHELSFAEAWNRAARGEAHLGDYLELSKILAFRFAVETRFDLRTGDPVLTNEAAHAAFCAYGDKGRFFERIGESAADGNFIYVDVKDWAATAKVSLANTMQDLVPAAPIGPQVGEIAFPTGKLLVSDWFRCAGFNEAVKQGEPTISLNSDAGIVASTLHKLSRGIVSFHLGNTCPSIFLRDGALLIGEDRAFAEADWESGEDVPDPREIEGKAGEVCTDLWAATIVDQKTLMDLLEAELGSAEAAFDAYAEYRKSTFDQIVEVTVEPGTYEVHFGPRHEEFAKAFRHDQVPALAEIAAYGALIPKRH